MDNAASDIAVLTGSGWAATPEDYSSMRTLHFTEDGLGTLTYGYGQTIYAIIKCRWSVPRAGVLELDYLESPAYQRFKGFVPDESNRHKELGYRLIEGEVEGVENIIARRFRYLWTLELSGSPYPEGLVFPYRVPTVYRGHYREAADG